MSESAVSILQGLDNHLMSPYNLTIDGVDESGKQGLGNAVRFANDALSQHIKRTEGLDVRGTLDNGTLEVRDDLDGAEADYMPSTGRTRILRKYARNPLKAIGVYAHEAGHKLLDKVFGYEDKLRETVYNIAKKDFTGALYVAQVGHALNEGLTDLYARLKLFGEDGFTSAYQRAGYVGAAAYALSKQGGKIRNLVNDLPGSINYFYQALVNPQLGAQAYRSQLGHVAA